MLDVGPASRFAVPVVGTSESDQQIALLVAVPSTVLAADSVLLLRRGPRRCRRAPLGAILLAGFALAMLVVRPRQRGVRFEASSVSRRTVDELLASWEVLVAKDQRLANSTRDMIDRLLRNAPEAAARHSLPVLPPAPLASKLAKRISSEAAAIRSRKQAKENRLWQIGDCFIDALIATEKLALAGTTLDSAVIACRTGGRDACVGDVAAIYAAFAAAVSYLSGVAGTCPFGPTNAAAMCASNMALIQYGLGTLAAAFSTIGDVCDPANAKKVEPIATTVAPLVPVWASVALANVLGNQPELELEHAAETVKPYVGNALCVINVAQAAAYIGHVVTSVRAASKDCSALHGPNASSLEASCASVVAAILQSLLLVAAYLTQAAALCGETLIVKAECSNRVASALAGLAEIAGGGSGAANNCRGTGVSHGNRYQEPNGMFLGAR